MIAVVLIHFGELSVTLRCLESLRANAGAPYFLIVVDNAATESTRSALQSHVSSFPAAILISNDSNVGFARACNQAIEHVIDAADLSAVALLNNDTLVESGWLARMYARLRPECNIDMVAAKMSSMDGDEGGYEMGLVLYRSGLSSSRRSPDEPLLGPCGGGAMYSARLVRRLRGLNGHVFDPAFFCYAEDTDLALRARALGYDCALAEDATLRHIGAHSSGGPEAEFVVYHGLRNALFVIAKNFPLGYLILSAPSILAGQSAILLKHGLNRRVRVLARVYRDFLKELPDLLRKRRNLQVSGLMTVSDLKRCSSPRLHSKEHVGRSLRSLFGGRSST